MSMLKSLQHLPGSITVFHSVQSPTSQQLVSLLQKNSLAPPQHASPGRSFLRKLVSSAKSERPSLYSLDVTESAPTKEQYASIRDSTSANTQNKDSFVRAFPRFEFRDVGLLPSMDDYGQFIQADRRYFKPPLVVDWEHGLLATDEAGVQKILEVFTNPAAEESAT